MAISDEAAREQAPQRSMDRDEVAPPADSWEVRKRTEGIIQSARDLLDDVDELLRKALNLESDASDALFADRARMMVANFHQKGGE